MKGVHSRPSIRRLTSDEWREYRALRLRALADSPSAFSTTLAEAQARDDSAWSRQVARGAESSAEIALVAESEARWVGLAWCGIDAEDRHRAWLAQMWVDPSFRSVGTGRQLLDAAIRWAAQLDARVMVLSVTCDNTAATRLYASAGFRPVGAPEPLRPGSNLLAQPMRLDLRGA